MIDLWVVRHGEPLSDWGQQADPGLSDLGQAQAASTLDHLAALNYQNIVSSPKQRARETAIPLLAATSNQLSIQNEIRELPSSNIPSQQRPEWLQRTLRSTWPEVSDEIQVWRNQIWDWALRLTEPTIAFSHFVVINALKSFDNPSGPVTQLLPDHASISHFQITDSCIRWLSTDRSLRTEVLS
ncbi:MAG: histidine phosphatase family protein [Gammaproteobacteria bacterium]|nr:histidine phosphatase family protein [Gammaproteobacteria bacterium]